MKDDRGIVALLVSVVCLGSPILASATTGAKNKRLGSGLRRSPLPTDEAKYDSRGIGTFKLGPRHVRLLVPKDVLSYYDGLADGSVVAEDGRYKADAPIAVLTAEFGGGWEADIKLVNGDVPYVDAVLFEDGAEQLTLDASDTMSGIYEFELRGDNGDMNFIVDVVGY